MNYIKQLQAQCSFNDTVNKKIEIETLDYIMYLTSSKFDDDTTVQTKDVLRFIERLYAIKRGI